MKKTKDYLHTRFSVEAILEAEERFKQRVNLPGKPEPELFLTVEVDGAEWRHDTPDEFFADYRRSSGGALYQHSLGRPHVLRLLARKGHATIDVGAPDRASIEAVFEVFEKHAPSCRLPVPPQLSPKVFIGHGRSPQWRDLKDHLHEKHNYAVEAYEIGARAGHAVRDILQDMLMNSSFAVLVMTGEDETPEGTLRARQNVIHEAGLFQGKLGFSRAIVLLEDGTEEFSNIVGVQQIRFSRNNIKETFGEVLATLGREFP